MLKSAQYRKSVVNTAELFVLMISIDFSHGVPEISSSISKAFCILYADEIEVSGIKIVSALGEVNVGWIVVLPSPGNSGSWLVFEQISCYVC